ncbi:MULTISPECIES: enoyl-CoA hydratase/isomerase family protein [Pacificibacter]|uniref:enoyl-CoA hydratase/isomerase family protein n=1 Tax=Pacificibacter TaxID=1042323 RepID=UPI001C087195|nr:MULTISPECIES: enoyl-CoA hydratase/isomerase family protein [Pacificibacter]MBU2936802.1 enoyl-CoA hydratase/isomerase family protein [Pacificibacter marinus]MDO6614794.1 enoyl-CoA hydratase/isomerase family protein [Pacificibacter sp. 1_MG-2023]
MTMTFDSLLVSQAGTVWTITLNRPEVKNAHDTHVFKEISQALDMLEHNDDCRCIVITGSGDFFSSGQDLRFTATATSEQMDEYGHWNEGTRQRMQRSPKPIVAAVNGPAIGGGGYIAMSCDLIVAVDTAFFQMREIQAGNHSGGVALLSVGRARSLEMSLLGRKVNAPEAERWGLINRCVPAAEFEDAVNDYAIALSELPPLAIKYTKKATNILMDSAGYSNHMAASGTMQGYLSMSPDGREAKMAFKEKRKPVFTGALPSRTT